MYHNHWGLRQSPYPDRPDPRRFYRGPVHDEALARLHFLVEQHRRMGLLLGGPGTGKSLVCQVFAAEMVRANRPVAVINVAQLEPRELLWQLAAQWGLNPAREESLFALWRQVSDRLCEFRLQKFAGVILLDNADQAGAETLSTILRLAACDASPDSRSTLVLTGCPETVQQLGPRILELAALRIDLEPWDEYDTQQFLTSTLRQAGCLTSPFDAQALARLYELSGGVPRRVSQLADLALLAGAGQQLQRIDRRTVENVYEELGAI